MANQKLVVESYKENGDWLNLKTNEGEISINGKSNPVIAAKVRNGAIEIEANVNVKGDKKYAWDINVEKPKSGGGGWKQKSPEEIAAAQAFEERKQRMIIAQSSAASAAQFYIQKGQVSEEDVLKFADKIYNFVIEKAK